MMNLCWEVTLGSPALSNSGVFLVFEQGGSTGYTMSVKNQQTVVGGPYEIELNRDYRVVVECNSTGIFTVLVNGTKVAEYSYPSMQSAFYVQYPFVGYDGITFAVCGGGAFEMDIDTSIVYREASELKSLIDTVKPVYDSTVGNASVAEYGQVTAAQKQALGNALSAAENTYADNASTPTQITSVYENLKAAYELFVSQIVPTPDKDVLNSMYTDSKELYDNTAEGTDYSQAPTAAKESFLAVLNSVKAALDSKTAPQSEIDSLVAQLTTATESFRAAIVKNGNPSALNERIKAAEKLLVKLHSEAVSYAELSALISASKAIANDASSSQAVIDSKYDELGSTIAKINENTLFWTSTALNPATDISGVKNYADGYKTVFKSDAGAPSWNMVTNSVNLPKTDKLVMNITEITHPDSDWSSVIITNGITGDFLNTKAISLVFGGSGGNGEVNLNYSLGNADNRQIATFGYSLSAQMQFAFILSGEGTDKKVTVCVDGLEVAQITNPDFVSIMENDLVIAYTSGNSNGNFETLIDLKPKKVLSYEDGDFVPSAMAGTGFSSMLSVYEQDGVQSIYFEEGCTFVDGIAVTKLAKNDKKIEFSVKIVDQGPTDWHAFLFSDGIETHAANTKGLAIIFGGDLSVQVKHLGQSGMGATPLWESAGDTFTKYGKKMRFKIYVNENDEICVEMNDQLIIANEAPEFIPLLEKEKLTMSLFGSADASSEFEVSYINEEDPLPYDSLEDDLNDYSSSEIVSLDDTVVTINDDRISFDGSLTIEEILAYLYATDDLQIKFFDVAGDEITDYSAKASAIATISMFDGDTRVKDYFANEYTGNANTGDSVSMWAIVLMISLILCAFVCVLSVRKRAQK